LSLCSKSSKKKKAKCLLNQFCFFDIVFVLTFLDEILSTINVLSIYLQSSTLDIIKCLKLVKVTITKLKFSRSDERFNIFYTKSEITASNWNTYLSNDKKRLKNINSTLIDYVITSTTCFKSNNTTIQKLRVLYFTVVDNILSEMNKKFDNNFDFLTANINIQSEIKQFCLMIILF